MNKTSWPEVILEALKKPWALYLISGLIVVILAAAGGLSVARLSIDDPTWRWRLFIPGLILLAVAIIIVLFRSKPAEVSPKKIKRKYKPINVDLEPGFVQSTFSITLSFKNHPPESRIYAVEFNPRTNEHWPRGSFVINPENNTGKLTITCGKDDNIPRTIIIAYIGDNSMKMVDQHNFCVRHGGTVGILNFCSDFISLEKIPVLRWGPAACA
ncbi:hypothetical protein [Puia dinghuensis]|uniref:Uncharacterized protein n=1 Tax=Puia dinghuensis TaxID=1792502 RepID=A0A8J2UIN5_9BACT|nr:hypothetical protein [Puia dinghuensis]GGB23148.1 hypothetical protein GCM10011511_53830 [Puia dinghuensis]